MLAARARQGEAGHLAQRLGDGQTRDRFLMNNGGDEYAVEAIRGKRTRSGVVEYRVKWEGFPTSDSTWEPEENLDHCAAKVQAFNAAATIRYESK